MTGRKAELGELETLILLAALRFGDGASVPTIREQVAERAGRELSRGATYATVSRLERKGFLERPVEGTDSDGGAHLFAVTPAGLASLRAAHARMSRMQSGLEDVLGATS